MGYRIAVVGATGNVGREVLDIHSERARASRPTRSIALASRRSQGKEVSFGDKTLTVQALEGIDFSGRRYCAHVGRRDRSRRNGRRRSPPTGCVVIDNSSAWRYDAAVPLIVPEVNADAVEGFAKKNIIANPNCSTAQLVVALKPLHEQGRRSSGSWSPPISRFPAPARRRWTSCFKQTRRSSSPILSRRKNSPSVSPSTVIPHIDAFMDAGDTKEEWKMVAETKKMLDPEIKLTATCVRVPVFVSHSEAVNIEFENEISADEARDFCANRPAAWSSTSARMAATSRLTRRPARTRPIFRASARIRPSITVSICGSFPTICARAPRSTRCRSQNC